MATLTIRKVADDTKQRLQARARRSGRSMEDEVRHILDEALLPRTAEKGLGSLIHALFQGLDADAPDARPKRSEDRLGPPPDLAG